MREIQTGTYISFFNGLELKYPQSFPYMKFNTVFVENQDEIVVAIYVEHEREKCSLRFPGFMHDMPTISNVTGFNVWIKHENNWMLGRILPVNIIEPEYHEPCI